MTNIPIAVGIAWYNREDYNAIRRIMADRHKLPRTFDEWRKKAERREQELIRNGHPVHRALIDSKTFPDWCRARNLDINAQARMEFANWIAKERETGRN